MNDYVIQRLAGGAPLCLSTDGKSWVSIADSVYRFVRQEDAEHYADRAFGPNHHYEIRQVGDITK